MSFTSDAAAAESGAMTYEMVLSRLGEFGRYQRRIYLLLCLPAISCALHKLSGVFLQAKPLHRCRLPYEGPDPEYSLPAALVNMTLPWDERADAWSSCRRLDADFEAEYFEYGVPSNVSVPCESYVYDTSQISSSATTDWDLVCGREWLRATADACVMLGVLLGAVTFGALSDKYGRRKVFLVSLVLQVTAGFMVAGAPEYYSFAFMRLIIGMTSSGVFLVAYVLAMEMVGPSKRTLAGVGCQTFFTLGYMLTAAIAYLIRDWRLLQVALTAPGILFLSYWWFVPESARWLLTQGRPEEAKQMLRRVAAVNGVAPPDALLERMLPAEKPPKDARQPSLLDLMRYPNMRRRALNIFFNWFVNNVTYYGLSWNTSSLGGNEYLNFFICGAVEIPAYTFLLLTLNRWGRKSILCGSMLAGGAVLLLTAAVPEDALWLKITLVMAGKLAVTASYGTVYIFTTEQFPTVIRNAALGTSSMCARVGGIIAPYLNLLAGVWAPLPQLLFGVLTLIAGVLALLLPETLNKTLPDTIEEGEKFGMKAAEDIEKAPAETAKKSSKAILIIKRHT
ncbi:organic cation transporter protein-like isoform X1 [Schistocerca nitens]|uniref:organic cation transporter protein-like isoform X1 n=2 Tax=Schistocerca nitens TaxID=7011 RepID=UPI0021177B58|nr:organic cation transporter protein-like isoform X1 [Schistocerca nitens]